VGVTETLRDLAAAVSGAQVQEPSPVKGYPCVKLAKSSDLLPALAWLKERGFAYLDMVSAIDWKQPVDMRGFVMDPNPNPMLPEGATPETPAVPAKNFPYRDSFELLYAVSSWESRATVFLRVEVPRLDPRAPSAIGLYKTADWQEREVYDLLGVIFEGHPRLKKILTPDFIQGHPLRKDYAHVKDPYD